MRPPPSPGSIESWTYTGPDVPDEADEQVRINLWLFGGVAPVNAMDAEVVVSRFSFAEAPVPIPALGGWGSRVLGLALVAAAAFSQARRSRRTRSTCRS